MCHLERFPRRSPPSNFPDFELGLFLDGITYDHRQGRAYYFSYGEDRLPIVQEALEGAELPVEGLRVGPFDQDLCRQEFQGAVEQIRQAIRAGEIYQAVLSRELFASYDGDLLAFYRALRRINPSPYMFFLDFGERIIAGSSPEMLVAVLGERVITYPIAGTRPLGSRQRERERYRQELLADEKERAEHAMLVDLARNDIGRVSEYGSVRVPHFLSVECFSHVQHLVSRVEGRLRRDLDALDAFAALFPAGTVTGAPKLRAMEIIAQLEKTARGPYAGAVGYLSLNGNLDMAIAIRTLYADKEKLFLRAGAGIVYDSVPQREWEETERKLAALRAALKEATSCAS